MPSWAVESPLRRLCLWLCSWSPTQLAELPCLPCRRSFHWKEKLSACFWMPQRAGEPHLGEWGCVWKEEIERANFAGSFWRHLEPVRQLCPSCSHREKFSPLPKPVLEQVVPLLSRDHGHRQELQNSIRLLELQLYLLLAQGWHQKEIPNPPGCASLALSNGRSGLKLGKFRQQLPGDSVHA